MAKFTKYNRRRTAGRRSPYSETYIRERKAELDALLANAKTEAEKDMLIKAFDVSIRP